MGLDVSIKLGLIPVRNFRSWDDMREGEMRPCNIRGFERCPEFDPSKVYRYKSNEHVYSSSYSGYNEWRDKLARIAGYGSAEDAWADSAKRGPFWELINFPDCEGTIGPSVARKLADDFSAHEHKAAAEGGIFAARYRAFHEAFQKAADGNGVVDFH